MFEADPYHRDAAVRRRLTGDIYERSPFHRGRLDRAGLGKSGVRKFSDLTRLPPMGLDDVRTPATLLLQRTSAAPGSKDARRYWPLQWMTAGPLAFGYSDEDLDRLADLGADLLRAAGVTPKDVIANVLPSGPSREHAQFTFGAQTLGASSMTLGTGATNDQVDALSATVLVGEAKEVARLLDAAAPDGALDRVHTAVIVGDEPTDRQRKRLEERLGHLDGAIVRAWAPDGVLALWGQCRGGSGFHTWPEAEVIELIDPLSGLAVPTGGSGLTVWTGTGWHGTAMVRLSTNVAAVLINGECGDCGRRSPRLSPVVEAPGFAGFLDDSDHVNGWAAELQRTAEGDELVIWVVPVDPLTSLLLLEELVQSIGPARVVLIEEPELDRRIEQANGERFVDRRAMPLDVE